MRVETYRESFVPVMTNPETCVKNQCYRPDLQPAMVTSLAETLNLPLGDSNRLDVFRWHNPFSGKVDGNPEYPQKLRNFTPPPDMTAQDIVLARAHLDTLGPYIPYPREKYRDKLLQQVEAANRRVIEHDVPNHQARGFKVKGIWVFATPHGTRIKMSACTKGSGSTGYWAERRTAEMKAALSGKIDSYPLNPDVFHARVHTGQSRGQQEGDEIIWVGCSTMEATKREVAGFEIYAGCGIFSPLCLPVRSFAELPLATGEFIPTAEFTRHFDLNAKLVYLAKAWALEKRIWRNNFSHDRMTAAHLVSVKENNQWLYQAILDDMTQTAQSRRILLDEDELFTRRVLTAVDPDKWQDVLGYAGQVLAGHPQLEVFSQARIIPIIIALNMIENVVQAGAYRLYGKPVAWHLENVGRWGEVSGGERIYGMARGIPDSREFHSLFAYLFDSYATIGIEWATAGLEYIPIKNFYQSVRSRILKLNPAHWIDRVLSLKDFVALCQNHSPDYQVNFRSEDAYPLIAVTGTTANPCIPH